MLISALSLVSVLNAIDAGLMDAPTAEAALTATGDIHHVCDPAGLIGAASHAAMPIRIALGRISHGNASVAQLGEGWALLTPRPGRPSGARGPKELRRRWTAESIPLVVSHRTGVVWQPLVLPADGNRAVQWELIAAQRPALSLTPDEAARSLTTQVVAAATTLTEAEAHGGQRAERSLTIRLGAAYPSSSQRLLDRGLHLLTQLDAAHDGVSEVLHSHAVLTREQALREVTSAALDAVEAAASWPAHLMR